MYREFVFDDEHVVHLEGLLIAELRDEIYIRLVFDSTDSTDLAKEQVLEFVGANEAKNFFRKIIKKIKAIEKRKNIGE